MTLRKFRAQSLCPVSAPGSKRTKILPPSPGPSPASSNSCFPSHVVWGSLCPLPGAHPGTAPTCPGKGRARPPREGGSDMALPPRSQPLLQVLPRRLPPALPFAAAGPAEGPGLKDRSCCPRQQGASANSPAHRSPSPWLGFYRLIFFTVFSGVERLAPSSSTIDCGVGAKERRFKYGMLRCTAV